MRNGKNGRWQDSYLFEIYEAAKMQKNKAAIARKVGINLNTFRRREKTRSALKVALVKGKEFREKVQGSLDGDETNILEYVYKRLDPEMKEYWDELNRIEKVSKGNKISASKKIERLFSGHEKVRMRQCLFIHAWLCSNFSISAALRKINLTRAVYNQWKNRSPKFAQLCDDVIFFKKDFAESAICRLVAAGDTTATIELNRAYNRNLGFGRSDVKVKHEGEIIHTHIVKMSDVEKNLSLEARRELLHAMQKVEIN